MVNRSLSREFEYYALPFFFWKHVIGILFNQGIVLGLFDLLGYVHSGLSHSLGPCDANFLYTFTDLLTFTDLGLNQEIMLSYPLCRGVVRRVLISILVAMPKQHYCTIPYNKQTSPGFVCDNFHCGLM